MMLYNMALIAGNPAFIVFVHDTWVRPNRPKEGTTSLESHCRLGGTKKSVAFGERWRCRARLLLLLAVFQVW
jgi:hypothetical protein